VLTWKLRGTKFNRSYFLLQASALPTDETEFGLLPTPLTAEIHHAERVQNLKAAGAKTMASRKNGANRPNGLTDYLDFHGLLLTPTTSEQVQDLGKFKARMEKYPNGTTMPNLATQVVGLLPTPKTFDCGKQRELDENGENRSQTTGQKYGIHLTQMAQAGMLPTPIAGDWKGQRRADGTASMLSGKAALGMLPTPRVFAYKDSATDRGKGNLGEVTGAGSQLNPRFVAEMMGFPANWTESPFQSGGQTASKPTETP